ncbi:DUF3307 domain-containing protein [Pelagivirga sediminicola]|uniref:DUF3307 domain-containing protein n=1 Tax=Pelagivirga sediminicola TaxID=2170575 RepID=A0A2T7GB03_9RHOB|nr:DUF3307 domain-containing protein [Pelagivirga sediminicola]PVA11610.1 DUF3307 domain-containing protein [Pelagivirga sediminicola]
MIETFTALLFAHVLADFVLQTAWINAQKRRAPVMLVHAALVLLCAQLATGHWDSPWLLALAAAHVLIDIVKIRGGFHHIRGFLADQAAHLVTIGAVAAIAPRLWQTGPWADLPALLPLMAIASGIIIALTAGQYAVALLMRPHGTRIRNNGLRDGGRQIGILERGLILTLILLNQPLGVGFLIAAKSILRFGTATRDQRTAEYVIIGTLASFGWAILTAEATRALLMLLPPLEIAGWAP